MNFSKIDEFLKNRENPCAVRRGVACSIALGLLGPSREHYDALRKKRSRFYSPGNYFFGSVSQKYDFWENFSKFVHPKCHSCEDRGAPATLQPVPAYYWMCVVRCTAGFSPRKLHGGIRGHYPTIPNFSKIMNFEKFELPQKWNLRKSKIFPMNITSKRTRTQILVLWGWVYPLQML